MTNLLDTAPTAPLELLPQHSRLLAWSGHYKGHAKVWLDPAAGPKEAPWEGVVEPILGGRFVRHTYRSQVDGQACAGEFTVCFNGDGVFASSWVDSFHSGSDFLCCKSLDGVDVNLLGDFSTGPGQPRWGWRIHVDDTKVGLLVIHMAIISPEGKESPGVEVRLERQ